MVHKKTWWKPRGVLGWLVTIMFVLPLAFAIFPLALSLLVARQLYKSKLKYRVALTVASIIIGVGLTGWMYSSTPSDTPQPTQSLKTAENTGISTQKMQEDFITFYKEFMKVGSQSDKTNDVILGDVEAFGNGGISKASLYLQVKKAEEIQGQLNRALPQVPESLKQYKEDLQKAENDMSTAIFSRRESMRYMAEYLNTGDLEEFRKAKESIQYQQVFMLDAVASLLSVAEKLNVDINNIESSSTQE